MIRAIFAVTALLVSSHAFANVAAYDDDWKKCAGVVAQRIEQLQQSNLQRIENERPGEFVQVRSSALNHVVRATEISFAVESRVEYDIVSKGAEQFLEKVTIHLEAEIDGESCAIKSAWQAD